MYRNYLQLTKLMTLVSVVALTLNYFYFLSGGIQVSADQPESDNVTICHRGNSVTNPYQVLTVDPDSADGNTGNDQGQKDHSEHTGPVATSESVAQALKDAKTDWGDIIPPHNNFVGLNWTTEGQAIWNNDCSYTEDEVDPTPTPQVNPGAEIAIEYSECGETDFSARKIGNHGVSNMRLVVEALGLTQSSIIPTDGSFTHINVGPFTSDQTLRYRVWGGGERNFDLPLWNGFGSATFVADINAYGNTNGWNWVINNDPNPFVTWYSTQVEGCEEENEIGGCLDPKATNYNASADYDNESCVYASPTPTPTQTPNNCPVEQSCPSHCGAGATDVANGSCGIKHCDPIPSCNTETKTDDTTSQEAPAIGGVSRGQVLGATTDTYAEAGIAEDIAFSLIGVAGTGLTSLGILMRRNEKK